MAKYRLSNKARQDLEDIWSYTAQTWSPGQADKYDMLLQEQMSFLADDSESGRSYDDIFPDYRRGVVKSHYIFFKTLSDGIIEIVRVLHQSMDIDERMKE